MLSLKFITVILVLVMTAFSASAFASEALSVSPICQKTIAELLELSPVFQNSKGQTLQGFDATWDEDLYLDSKAPVSVIFVSDRIEYLYFEPSDVGGTVYRCDKMTGQIQPALPSYQHYPDCEQISEAIQKETDLGSVQFNYCAGSSQN